MIFFSFMLIMPILPLYLSEEFGSGKHTIGVVLSGYSLMALLARMFSGYIVDTYNRKTVLLLSYGLFATFFLGYLIGGSLILFAIIRTLHGAPFGTVTVSNSTVAIDVLPAERRAEGIGYYGLSNNLATAISPTVGIYMYETWGNFQAIFLLSFLMAASGFLISKTVKHSPPSKIAAGLIPPKKSPFSLDRFFLVKGWSVGLMLAMLSFSYGVLSTYLAIYAKEELGMTQGRHVRLRILLPRLRCHSQLLGLLRMRHNTRLGQRPHVPRRADYVREPCPKQPQRHRQFIHADLMGPGYRSRCRHRRHSV